MNEDRGLRLLLDKIHRAKGLDFSFYRQNTLRRRIGSRLRATGCLDYMRYAAYLNSHPEEYERFLEEITINVTEFFRNPETFAVIEDRVLPKIIKGKDQDSRKSLRIWCAGTSYGEETYSMAILCLEFFRKAMVNFDVKVYGTDIDPACIERAKAGLYESIHLKGVNQHLLKKYFLKDGENYRVKDEVKDLTEFKVQNLISDQPLVRLDLILCRNVLIYFNKALQEFVTSLFFRSLNKSGFLVLGKVETLWGYVQDSFEAIDNRERVYRKII